MSMEYVSVSARFLFFNGVNSLTVEYSYGLSKWFIFNENETSGAVYMKEDKKIKLSSVNCLYAEDILCEYLDTKI